MVPDIISSNPPSIPGGPAPDAASESSVASQSAPISEAQLQSVSNPPIAAVAHNVANQPQSGYAAAIPGLNAALAQPGYAAIQDRGRPRLVDYAAAIRDFHAGLAQRPPREK